MDSKIFRNSYVIFVLAFIILYIFFYLTGIGQSVEIVDGKPVKKTSWKYPLGLSLIIWVFWHYYLYPVNDDIDLFKMTGGNTKAPVDQFDSRMFSGQTLAQQIDMNNWT